MEPLYIMFGMMGLIYLIGRVVQRMERKQKAIRRAMRMTQHQLSELDNKSDNSLLEFRAEIGEILDEYRYDKKPQLGHYASLIVVLALRFNHRRNMLERKANAESAHALAVKIQSECETWMHHGEYDGFLVNHCAEIIAEALEEAAQAGAEPEATTVTATEKTNESLGTGRGGARYGREQGRTDY